MYMDGYTCVVCEQTFPVDLKGYTCTSCGGNLDVTYDYARLKKDRGLEKLFVNTQKGIFRYLDLLPINDPQKITPLCVGNTPLYKVKRLAEPIGLKHVYLKDDGLNPSGSFKDRASAIVLSRALEIGVGVIGQCRHRQRRELNGLYGG